MRGTNVIARKLITKTIRTGSERDAENEDRIVLAPGTFAIVATEDDRWLLMLDPNNVQTTFWSKAVFPITDQYNYSTQIAQKEGQQLTIQGQHYPGVETFIEYRDGSYENSFLGRRNFYLDYQGKNKEFKEICAQSDGERCYFYMFEDSENGNLFYDLLIEGGEIVITNEESKIAFSTSRNGVVNTLLQYNVNNVKVVGAQQLAIANPVPNVADNAITSLPIGTTYNQAEVQSLRNQVEALRDVLESTRSQLIAALEALRQHGLIAT